MGAQKNHLIETVLLSTHNICFGSEIRKIFSVNTLLMIGLHINSARANIRVSVFYMGFHTRNLSLLPANNKSIDQPGLPCRLISAFVIHYLKSIVVILAPCKISIF